MAGPIPAVSAVSKFIAEANNRWHVGSPSQKLGVCAPALSALPSISARSLAAVQSRREPCNPTTEFPVSVHFSTNTISRFAQLYFGEGSYDGEIHPKLVSVEGFEDPAEAESICVRTQGREEDIKFERWIRENCEILDEGDDPFRGESSLERCNILADAIEEHTVPSRMEEHAATVFDFVLVGAICAAAGAALAKAGPRLIGKSPAGTAVGTLMLTGGMLLNLPGEANASEKPARQRIGMRYYDADLYEYRQSLLGTLHESADPIISAVGCGIIGGCGEIAMD